MKRLLLKFYFVLFLLLLFTISPVYASSNKIDYQIDYNNDDVGTKWNASSNPQVLQDQDDTTFYGLSGAGTIEMPISFILTNIISIEISWHSGPNGIAPSNYYFGYLNEKNEWVFPNEWSSSGSYQEFNTLHKFVLTTPIETSKIKLVREGTGPGSGIALSELYVLDYKNEDTNSQTVVNTDSKDSSSTKKSSSEKKITLEKNVSVISSIKNETFIEPLTLSYENSNQTDNYLIYLATITVILILIYALLKILKR